MPAKKGAGKAEQKKKEKIVEDKTFGLKNKNRSKAVQKYVQTVQQSAKMGSKDQRAAELEREKKKQEKMEKKMREQELKKLYGGVEEKKDESAAAAAAAERGEYLWTADDFEEIEQDDTRLEEQLEEERSALVGRTDLTPVNEETFQKWWQGKKEEEKKKRDQERKAQIKKFRQTGRGISGRALFEHDATIFVDDDAALDEIEREDQDEVEEQEAKEAQDAALFDGEDLPDDDDDEE